MEGRSHVTARFFKVILPSTSTRHKLRIPTKFVDKYGDELSSVVKLVNLVDATWYVKLEKVEKSLWLNNGWKKFVDDHSIGYFYFLVFEYTGNSSFKVHIFDSTATEVVYSINNLNFGFGGDDDTKMEEISDDDSAQIIDFFDTKPENPSFSISLKPYTLSRSQLYVPAAFWEYLPSGRENFELHDSDGKKWLIYVIGLKNGQKYLGKGWREVLKEKGLKVGDTCVFEFVDVNKWMLKVSRNTKKSPKRSSKSLNQGEDYF